MSSMTPYVTPFADVVGTPRAAAASLAALSPGGFMAPNYVYKSSNQFYVTNTLASAPVQASCSARPGVCADAITRGLLSGMQPMMGVNESVFPEDRAA